MNKISTVAIRAFQQKVYQAKNKQLKNIPLTIAEANNLDLELSQLLAILLEAAHNNSKQDENIEVSVSSPKF